MEHSPGSSQPHKYDKAGDTHLNDEQSLEGLFALSEQLVRERLDDVKHFGDLVIADVNLAVRANTTAVFSIFTAIIAGSIAWVFLCVACIYALISLSVSPVLAMIGAAVLNICVAVCFLVRARALRRMGRFKSLTLLREPTN